MGDLMLLNINAEISPEVNLIVKIGGDIKIINNINKKVSFNIEKNNQYTIYIKEIIDESNRTFKNILFFICTLLIQGIFHILFFNTDSNWLNNVKAWCIKAKVVFCSDNDLNLQITYIKSYYDSKRNIWSNPIINVNPVYDLTVYYKRNKESFFNQFFNYIKKLISVSSIVLIIFLYLLYVSVLNKNVLAILITTLIIISIVCIIIFVIKSEYKKLKKNLAFFLIDSSIEIDMHGFA